MKNETYSAPEIEILKCNPIDIITVSLDDFADEPVDWN